MNLKAIVLSLGLAAMMAPATLNAQINHGLLNDPYNDNSNMNHGLFNQQGNRSGSYELQNQTFEEPLGPATELVENCYAYMFHECGNLKALICLATNIPTGSDCTTDWLKGVSNTNPFGEPTFTKAKGASFWDDLDYDDGIPFDWTVNVY